MSGGNRLVPDSPTLVDSFASFYRNYYEEEIAELARRYPRDQKSLWLDYDDLYRFDPDLADDLRERPDALLTCAETALEEFDLPAGVDLQRAHVRVKNLPSSQYPDDIMAEDIETMVAISGQLTRVTQIAPRLKTAVFSCQRCGAETRISQPHNDTTEPHECSGCERQGPFRIDTQRSHWVDQRKIKLEEPIEERSQARGHSVPVYVEDDLCTYGPGSTQLPDHAGEAATFTGIVRVDESSLTGRNASPESSVWIEANAVSFDTDVEADIDVHEHRPEFEEIASRDDAVELVAASLAPSLHAQEGDDLYVARLACAAWLFNAYRLDPEGSESKRGDMHMALIGDPGTGKSSLMQYLHEVLPKSEFRTGPGLTEVGLTAAAVQEEFAGETEWTLQPGVLPRADGGHCIIDEVDAVVDENTKAIHDALEGEQVVKADKAGIKADLPSRCALLVGGNPTYTRFDRHEPITEQIDLDPALFDRMDLVFSMQDEVDEERDRTKADHTLQAWKELALAEAGEIDVNDAETTRGPVSKATLRAWIKFARENVHPIPTEDAMETLREYYVEVRDLNDSSQDEDAAIPATMRTLEAGIRVAMSYARLRLSDSVEVQDAERAISLSKRVVGLRFDPESGQFDDRMMGRGDTKSQHDRRKQLRAVILRLSDEDDGGPGADVEDVVAAMDAEDQRVRHDIQKRKQAGDVTEPTTGRFRWIG